MAGLRERSATVEAQFDAIVGAADPPLVVVTAAAGSHRAGCLVGFHCQSSIEPRLYCVLLSKANHTYRVARHADCLAVHFLTEADMHLARHFGELTGDRVDKFADLEVIEGPGGVPVLRQCANWLAGPRSGLLDEGGDHVYAVIHPAAVSAAGPFRPLRASAAAHLTPGHPTSDSEDATG
jgi:flavin reductase (DIM6/NTAB) family NADH-FMN oxidoreductase RutF